MRRRGRLTSWLLPYRDVERGDIVVFHHPQPPLLVKRVVGLPGDRLRIEDGRVIVNGVALDEPYAAFEPAPPNPFRDTFPAASTPTPRWTPIGGGRCKASSATASWWFLQGSTSCSATIATTARIPASGDLFPASPSWPGR